MRLILSMLFYHFSLRHGPSVEIESNQTPNLPTALFFKFAAVMLVPKISDTIESRLRVNETKELARAVRSGAYSSVGRATDF